MAGSAAPGSHFLGEISEILKNKQKTVRIKSVRTLENSQRFWANAWTLNQGKYDLKMRKDLWNVSTCSDPVLPPRWQLILEYQHRAGNRNKVYTWMQKPQQNMGIIIHGVLEVPKWGWDLEKHTFPLISQNSPPAPVWKCNNKQRSVAEWLSSIMMTLFLKFVSYCMYHRIGLKNASHQLDAHELIRLLNSYWYFKSFCFFLCCED